jgi:4-amino-4-deoxy-L-arabinose transferase-like glycosyltransferase
MEPVILETPHNEPSEWRRAIWLVVWAVVVVLALGYGIGGYGLIEPDEGRNAEVAREMAATGNYLLPHLNGLPYLDKPVVFFAAAAAMIEVFGPNEFAVRLAPLLFALAIALMVGGFARGMFGLEASLVAGLATVTAPLALALSRTVIMDTALSFFVVAALISFFEAVEKRQRAGEMALGWTLLAWAAMAAGVLTKGPVALAVPLLVAAPYAVYRRASKAVWHPLGPLILVAVAAPWVWAVSREIPNFLHYVVVTETWARMTSDELRRTEPIWFFLPVLLIGTFPWSILALSGRRTKGAAKDAGDRHIRVFLWLWLLVPLVFFSLSRGKQEQYVLPLVPAVALLVASRWHGRPRGLLAAAVGWGGLGLVVVGMAIAGVPGFVSGRVPVEIAARAALGFGIAAVVGAVLVWLSTAGRLKLAAIGLSLPLVVFPIVAAPVLKAVADDRSTRRLADAVELRLTPETELLWVASYAAGLSFYFERAIPVASTDGAEFRSNYILRNAERFFDESDMLLPLAAVERAVSECTGPRVLFVGAARRDLVGFIEESGVPMLAENRRWIAFGPGCASLAGTEVGLDGEARR